MFLCLIDKFGLFGIICIGLLPVVIGVFLFFMTRLITDKKWAMIILTIIWYLLLVYSVGGFAKHGIFVYTSVLYVFTVLSGVLIFSGVFRHRFLLYFLCWLSFFLHGVALSLALKEVSIYDLARCGFNNVEHVEEWGVNRMLLTSDDKERFDMAHRLKKHVKKPIQQGLAELCLGNYHEAAAGLKKAQGKDNSSFLEGVVKYCDGEYKDAALIFFENDYKEMSALVNLYIVAGGGEGGENKKRVEKQILRIMSVVSGERGGASPTNTNIGWNIRYIMFLSMIWGQIITIPMIVFRRSAG